MKDWFLRQHMALRAVIVIIVFGIVATIVQVVNNLLAVTPE